MNELLEDFYRNKKILVTGHTGFIGSWLSIWLNELGAKVTGLGLKPYTEKDNFVVTNLKEKIESIIGDIRNYNNLNNIFTEHPFDIIFHLAAQPIVRESYKNPKNTYEINIGGTINILEIFRYSKSARVFLNITTDKCYQDQGKRTGYVEDDPLGGYDPYSSSKACSDLITSAYRNSFFKGNNSNRKAISSVRMGNVLGGGDWQNDRLIPDFIKAVLKNQALLIRNPNYVRPWQLVLEPLRGILILAKRMWEDPDTYSSAWNFGPNQNEFYSVITIIKKLINILGKGTYKIQSESKVEDLHETFILILDSSKAKKFLNWEQSINIDESLKFVADWYMSENINYDFDVRQIKHYLNKIK